MNFTDERDHIPVSGRPLFKDTFADLNLWAVISGTPTVSNGVLSLPVGAEVRTKRSFSCGQLVIVAKSDVAATLQIGFNDGTVDYVHISNGYLRCKSTADQTEGTTAITFTETNYNIFALVWALDTVIAYVNGGGIVVYQGIKIPHKSLPISIKNIGSGTVSVTAVTLYPEPIGIEPANMGNVSGLGNVSMPIYITGGTVSTISAGTLSAYIANRLLAVPYTDSTSNLGASATFTGTGRDLQISSTSPFGYYDGIIAVAYSDQAGTLYIDESPDNSVWTNGVSSIALVAASAVKLIHKATCRYARVRYVNGATAQGSFKLYSRVVGDAA